MGDAAEATGDALTRWKDSAVETGQETLDAIGEKWQVLEAKAKPTTDEAKVEFQEAKDRMAQALADVEAELVEAKDAGADTWKQNGQPALDAAMKKAQKIYEDAAAQFGSK